MANNQARAEFWKEFVTDRCDFPAVSRLRAQLENAQFHDFCQCGCNSFRVAVTGKPPAIAAASKGPGRSAIFTADFDMPDGKNLEIILFADPEGNLDYIEVDYCANSYPVPEQIDVGKPSQTWASESILG